MIKIIFLKIHFQKDWFNYFIFLSKYLLGNRKMFMFSVAKPHGENEDPDPTWLANLHARI